MIEFNYETEFIVSDEARLRDWILQIIRNEGFSLGEMNYIFCDDVYLHKLNVDFLGHDTFTDIISFDASVGMVVSGDIFISVDRVRENAELFEVSFVVKLQTLENLFL